MKRWRTMASGMALLAAAVTLPGQEAVPAGGKANPAAELEELQAQFQQAQQEFYALFKEDTAPEEIGRLLADRERNPRFRFLPRFEDLARRAAGTDTAVAAWVQVFALAETAEDKRAVIETLARDYIGSQAMEGLASNLRYAWYELGLGTTTRALRHMMAESPHGAVRAAASFTLACILMDAPGWKDSAAAADAGIGAFQQPEEGDPAAARDREEARALLVALGQKYPQTRYAKQAEGYLFELDRLQIGMVAPDFEAEDQDGVKFRLSDYRGKVVVLDFWGFW